MELFMPSQNVLEAICWDKEAYRQYVTLPAETPEFGLVGLMESLVLQIPGFYSKQFGLEIGKEELSGIISVAWEGLQNSQLHGSKAGKPFTYGFLMARRGLCHGFHDSGDYFKNENVKRRFEGKIPLTEFDSNEMCHRIGVNKYIFPRSDLIEVDAEKGILYCVQLVKNQSAKK